ncbi:DUF3159 domain-containing protein [Streptomyces acidicola]|uniref:DUF3159 domain-containing protein n=1 Tax=Streptomyces acidicola TaxID=2596892 RepID=UPI0037F3BDEE
MALPGTLTVEELFAPPQRARASISPDGTRIAYLAPWQGRLNVWVQGVGPAAEARRVTADENRSALNYSWTDDPRRLLYLQDDGGDENWHLYRVDLDDPDAAAVDLTPFPTATVLTFTQPVSRPGKAVVQMNIRQTQQFDLHELDIATGELTTPAENPGHVSGWLIGGEGALFASRLTSDGDIELSRWDNDARTLHPIAVCDGAAYPMGVFPVQITPDGTAVWIGSNRGTDRTRLVRLDLSTGEETEVAVFTARFIVRQWLYEASTTGRLAFAKIAMGFPLLGLAAVVGIWAVRRAAKRREVLAGELRPAQVI